MKKLLKLKEIGKAIALAASVAGVPIGMITLSQPNSQPTGTILILLGVIGIAIMHK